MTVTNAILWIFRITLESLPADAIMSCLANVLTVTNAIRVLDLANVLTVTNAIRVFTNVLTVTNATRAVEILVEVLYLYDNHGVLAIYSS